MKFELTISGIAMAKDLTEPTPILQIDVKINENMTKGSAKIMHSLIVRLIE